MARAKFFTQKCTIGTGTIQRNVGTIPPPKKTNSIGFSANLLRNWVPAKIVPDQKLDQEQKNLEQI